MPVECGEGLQAGAMHARPQSAPARSIANWSMTIAHATRTRWRCNKSAIITGLLRVLKREKIGLAYPTQTTFTAAPDGTMVMPYAPPAPAGKGLMPVAVAGRHPRPHRRGDRRVGLAGGRPGPDRRFCRRDRRSPVHPCRSRSCGAQTPFGGTIAHGFLTLSLLSRMASEVMLIPAGAEDGRQLRSRPRPIFCRQSVAESEFARASCLTRSRRKRRDNC